MTRSDRRESAQKGGTSRPFVIGLTGPIASGKSTIGSMLRARGAVVIDADQVYRSLLNAGSPLWKQIVRRFGRSIVGSDDEIDRAKLGQLVFQDSAALAELDRMTHPAVVNEIRRQITKSTDRVLVIEAVKLVQAGLLADIDRLWVVTADSETRLRRLMSRAGMNEPEARRRIDSASDPSTSRVHGDVSIDTSGPLEGTELAVAEAWNALGIELSQHAPTIQVAG